ncbi:hypothetical protein BX616_005836 [Lobosporangium transversale]|uniref:Uncharacterized protein n=1 Tax=Lobosporangium transversale TaxID=64571 RepID=A0A1Y2GJI4_9FUNG|nr:hypothetical protein BCR41DRAFT_423189 [Lobosporangium transversale]KAF9915578.1 hypothetical protein BX616_005836 [Lobosporangium transversale]ORZ12557.1 hypothetical protein BCR41DRAFT_423189 [Lobosporangium transversale]|eukprot:XP_021880176.1 hypothetical protein BCR41DRAFT_423189 [Lobosporangium transversale]
MASTPSSAQSAADADTHGSIQTTTGTLEPAPEVLLTRGYPKRSLAALETEFVDNNDINSMAPSSAVLQSSFLIMDDAHNLEDKVDKSDHVTLPQSQSSSAQPPPKRVRYGSLENEPTATDYALLEPIIHPDKDNTIPRARRHSAAASSSIVPSQTSHPTMSRRRSLADLVHSSSQRPPVVLDEAEATAAYGEPIDTSSPSLGMDIDASEQPPTPVMSRYPGSSQVAAGINSSSPTATESSNTPTYQRHDSDKNNVQTSVTGGRSSGPRSPSSVRSPSSLFMPSQQSHTTASHRRNSTSAKKGFQRPVRIQLLDKAESEQIREQARRDSASSGDQEQRDRDDDSETFIPQDGIILRNSMGSDNDSDIALLKEDPSIHDWDKEELEDEENGSSTPAYGGEPLSLPLETSQRRKSLENDIRRAANASGKPTGALPRRRPGREGDNSYNNSSNGDDNEDEDDDWDPLRDPEREIAVMSEDQEADLHNVHLRLENQREFQDAASLDLGEAESQAVNEDGQYGGSIQEDDEGEDFWENR